MESAVGELAVMISKDRTPLTFERKQKIITYIA